MCRAQALSDEVAAKLLRFARLKNDEAMWFPSPYDDEFWFNVRHNLNDK
jgi:hypothetical protein